MMTSFRFRGNVHDVIFAFFDSLQINALAKMLFMLSNTVQKRWIVKCTMDVFVFAFFLLAIVWAFPLLFYLQSVSQ